MKAVIAGSGILPKYLFHTLRALSSDLLRTVRRTGGSVASLDSSKLWDFKIPVPEPEEQERIASILDKFDTLVNDIVVGLPAELTARRKQYEYYRAKLLTFKEYAKG
jgi:type I restriction enzyme S subunit